MRLSFERFNEEALGVPLPGAVLAGREGEPRPVLPESQEHVHSDRGFCGNLGDPVISTDQSAA
jgi:hypothetical protein